MYICVFQCAIIKYARMDFKVDLNHVLAAGLYLPDIMIDNDTVSATRAKDCIVPRQGSYSSSMTIEGSDLPHSVGIPYLNR